MNRLLTILLAALGLLAQAQTTYPPRIEGDSAHAPFYHGVASGDPLPNAVILWTRITPDSLTSDPVSVNFEVSESPTFTSTVLTGTATTGSDQDWTAKVDAAGLLPYTTYYYRFSHGASTSATGRTRTAPSGAIDHLRIAAGSCSSVWSGYYNAYARMAERNDLDLFLHAGDFIYDYADADEQVRMPVPDFPDPTNLQQWRDLHAYNCLDVDFRAARQSLPFAIMWHNHDLDAADSTALREAIRAFHEWTPTRIPSSADSLVFYRTLRYGDLLDIVLMDVLLYSDTDTLPDGQPVFIGDTQFEWLKDEMLSSTAQWIMLESQNMMGQFLLTGLPGWIPFGDGEVMDSSAWDGYGSERERVLNFLDSAGISNVVVVSGDAHFSVTMDLDPYPTDGGSYDPATGNGSVAVEFAPPSISRGNLDEMGLGFAESILIGITDAVNPHHLYKEFLSHGYGILDIRPDSIVAEYWYSDILSPATSETFAGGWVVRSGDSHWQRSPTTTPTDTSTVDVSVPTSAGFTAKLFPNPTSGVVHIQYQGAQPRATHLSIVDAAGRIQLDQSLRLKQKGEFTLSIENLSAGHYWVILSQGENALRLPLTVQ